MRLVHDYNYKDLGEVLYDIFYDVQKLKVFSGYLESRLESNSPAVSFSHELLNLLEQHLNDFDSVFDRINRMSVPPEGVEEIPSLVYHSKIKAG